MVPEDLIIAAKDLLSSLQELYTLNLWHNDLHDENILVTKLSDSQMRLFGRSISRIYKIIDVGSMTYRNPSDAKVWGDIVNVGSHLFQLSNSLKTNFSKFSKEDQFFITLMDEIYSQLMDEDPSRNFSSPIEALDQIEKYYRLSRIGRSEEIRKLDGPYGFINANDIPSPWLLKHMFSDKLSYFKDIMSTGQQSLLITGPRGSGKTMILKNMRFITFYDSQETKSIDLLDEIPYVGLFVSARTNFGNFLVSFREQEWIDNESKVMLYFNILVTLEVIDILYRLSFDNFLENSSLNVVIEMIGKRFSFNYLTLNTAKSKLVDLSRYIISGKDVDISIDNSSPAYLNDLLSIFRSAIPVLRNKEIFLLVDDLSLPRVPLKIQKSIIPSIFNTGASYKTRVTSHSEGLIKQDFSGEVYNTNRDYREINLGFEYWELSNNYEVCRDSFNDILEKRFQLAKRPEFYGIEKMLGRIDKLEDIGREIFSLKRDNKLRTLNYHGSNVFVKLCTGDLSYLLDILGKMELRNEGTNLPIKVNTQNNVIRNYARNELSSLQDIKAEHVPSLYNIAYYFGVLSKSKLVKNNADYLKIEVEIDDLSTDLLTTLRELLCYGIFIDAGYSNNSDGKLTKKLYFRRIFTPAFPTTFVTRNSFPMRSNTFKEFVYDPANFARKRMSKDKISPIEQQELEQLELF